MPGFVTGFWASIGYLGFTLATATALAYWLFRLFSEKWLSAKFNERLEDHKHEQQKALEHLRFQMNATMDRTMKLHQFEFEVLPKLWGFLTAAYGQVSRLVAALQSYPDLDRMNESELAEFLEKCPLAEWQKKELREGGDKGRRYTKMIFWHDLNMAYGKYYEFNNYLIAMGIFIPDDLKAEMGKLRDMMLDALVEKQFEEEHPDPREGRFAKSRALRSDGAALLSTIESAVRARLQQTALATE